MTIYVFIGKFFPKQTEIIADKINELKSEYPNFDCKIIYDKQNQGIPESKIKEIEGSDNIAIVRGHGDINNDKHQIDLLKGGDKSSAKMMKLFKGKVKALFQFSCYGKKAAKDSQQIGNNAMHITYGDEKPTSRGMNTENILFVLESLAQGKKIEQIIAEGVTKSPQTVTITKNNIVKNSFFGFKYNTNQSKQISIQSSEFSQKSDVIKENIKKTFNFFNSEIAEDQINNLINKSTKDRYRMNIIDICHKFYIRIFF